MRVYFQFGKKKSWVDLRVREFGESVLKGAIAEKLAVIFGQERAKSFVGKSFSFDEVVRDGSRYNESKGRGWFFGL